MRPQAGGRHARTDHAPAATDQRWSLDVVTDVLS